MVVYQSVTYSLIIKHGDFKAQTHLKKICGNGTSSKQKWIVGPQMDWYDWSLVPNPVLFKVSN
jgi:hypothetical protein